VLWEKQGRERMGLGFTENRLVGFDPSTRAVDRRIPIRGDQRPWMASSHLGQLWPMRA
jgi:hypothetical protein